VLESDALATSISKYFKLYRHDLMWAMDGHGWPWAHNQSVVLNPNLKFAWKGLPVIPCHTNHAWWFQNGFDMF
jgi:hypothetical protein